MMMSPFLEVVIALVLLVVTVLMMFLVTAVFLGLCLLVLRLFFAPINRTDNAGYQPRNDDGR